MAKNTAAVLDESIEAEIEAELTPKQIINEGIGRVVEATGIDIQKSRYKAMRAIAYQAFVEAIESEDFDGLVDRAIQNADSLPSGWELERAKKAEETPTPAKAKAAAKPAAKATTAKAATTKPAAAKTTRPRRPAR